MLKKVFYFVKKVIFSFIFLYSLNLFVNGLNILIPINFFTLGTVTFLGIPGLISLVVMFFIIK